MTVPSWKALGAFIADPAGIDVAYPAGWAAGDLLFIVCETANQTLSTPSGWTLLSSVPQTTGTAGGTSATALYVWYRFAQSGDSGTVAIGDSGNHQMARMFSVSDADGTTPVLITAGSVLASAGLTGTATGFTTTAADCLILFIGTNATDSASLTCTVANATVSSLAARFTDSDTSGNGGGISVATGVMATAGAIGSSTFTWGFSEVQAMLVVAVQPTVPAEQWLVKTGNVSDPTAWNTGSVPTSGNCYANGFTGTIDQNFPCNVFTTAGTTAVAGGGWTLANGVTLTGNCTAGTTTCVTYSGTTGNSATIVGNPIGSSTTSARAGAVNTSSGTLIVTGSPQGGTQSTSYGVSNTGASGTLNITGNPTGGSATDANGANASAGTMNITGSPTGGTASSAAGARWSGSATGSATGNPVGNTGAGVSITSSNSVAITGSTTGGSGSASNGVLNSGSGTVTVSEDATGGTHATAYGASNTGTGTLTVAGKAISNVAPGVNGATSATLTSVGTAETGANCIAPLSGKVVFASLTAATYGIRNAAAELGTLSAGGKTPVGLKQQVIG